MAKTIQRRPRGSPAAVRMSKRPALPKADVEMQRWSAILGQELSTWPRVTSRPMFGMIGFYRRNAIFAALPRTRAVETPFSLMIKLPSTRNDRPVGAILRQVQVSSAPHRRASGPGAAWVTFEMESENDIPEVLRWLERAYEKARTR